MEFSLGFRNLRMKVVILCGGQGTRIRDIAENIPKPMIKIGTYPILWHIMQTYASAGHKEFVLCLGHLGHLIKEFFLNYNTLTNDFSLKLNEPNTIHFHNEKNALDWHVTLAETGNNVMTGARIKRIKRYIASDQTFMLTYGDGLSDLDFSSLIDFHNSHGKTMTLTGVRPPGRFGELEVDQQGKAVEFNEKPQATGGMISGGFFVCQNSIFDWLDDNPTLVFENDPMRNLVASNELMVYQHDGFWQCMDTARDHRLLTSMWDSGSAPWKNWL